MDCLCYLEEIDVVGACKSISQVTPDFVNVITIYYTCSYILFNQVEKLGLHKIVTVFPLLKFHRSTFRRSLYTSIDELPFVLNAEGHHHCSALSVVVLSIQWLCNEDESRLIRIM